MDLELGIVLSCTGKQCQVRLLTSGEQVNARYCEPMLEHQITAQPGQLIALDRSVDPLQIVYRYPHIMVVPAEPSHLLEQASADHILIRDGQLVDLEHLHAESLVEIQAMYERMEAAQQLDPKRIVEQGYGCTGAAMTARSTCTSSGMQAWTSYKRLRKRSRNTASK